MEAKCVVGDHRVEELECLGVLDRGVILADRAQDLPCVGAEDSFSLRDLNAGLREQRHQFHVVVQPGSRDGLGCCRWVLQLGPQLVPTPGRATDGSATVEASNPVLGGRPLRRPRKMADCEVTGCPTLHAGDTWGAINAALKVGRRGVPGGSSLSRFLRKHGRKAGKETRSRLCPDQGAIREVRNSSQVS